jgi:hypothetical protein
MPMLKAWASISGIARNRKAHRQEYRVEASAYEMPMRDERMQRCYIFDTKR